MPRGNSRRIFCYVVKRLTMLNKNFLFLTLAHLLLLAAANGQYTFEKDARVYQPLDPLTSTDIVDGYRWGWGLAGDTTIEVYLGFTFTVEGKQYDSVRIIPNGGIIYLFESCYWLPFATPAMWPLHTELTDRDWFSGGTKSPIRYKTSGAAGARKFIIEWWKAGFDGGDYYDFLSNSSL